MRRTPGGRAVNDPGRSGNAVIPQKYTFYRGNLQPSEQEEEQKKKDLFRFQIEGVIRCPTTVGRMARLWEPRTPTNGRPDSCGWSLSFDTEANSASILTLIRLGLDLDMN